MKKILLILFPIFILWGCTVFDETGPVSDKDMAPSFTLDEAKEIFESQYTKITTKAGFQNTSKLNPSEFTPQWEKNRYSALKTKSGYDIPIIADKKLRAVRVSYYGSEAKVYKVDIVQRLLVMKDGKTGVGFSYILTLVPDINSSDGYKAIKDFVPFSLSKNSYSGLAIYTLPGTNELIRVSRYEDGKKVDGVSLLHGSGTYIQKLKKMAHLLSGTIIQSCSSIKTRFGEYGEDDYWEDDYWEEDYSEDELWEGNDDFTDVGDGLYQDSDGNYYEDLDNDGYPETPCIDPSIVEEEYPDEIPDPEYGEDGGYIETEPKDPNEDDSWLYDDGNSTGDSNSNEDETLSWKDIPFDDIDLMKDEYFVKYQDSKDCLRGCKDIMENMGFDDYGSSAEVIYLVRENDQHNALENYGDDVEENYKNAVDCINDHLEDDRPIIVGIDHSLGRDYNDGTIDHFVLIVGSGYDEDTGENYYIYVETGTSDLDTGVDPEDNRFYYDDEQGMFIDESDRLDREATITEVRPNNGEDYDTIVQPSK